MILPAILKRRAVRRFTPDVVDDLLLQELLSAAECAPTSHHNAAVHYVVIRDPSIKTQLFELLEQDFLTEAPVLIVPVTAAASTASPVQDLSLATENIFLQAAFLGLGSVWKNVAPEQAERVRAILQLPSDRVVINILPIGFPAESVELHSGEVRCEKIHRDRW